jgi:hypothetical protein
MTDTLVDKVMIELVPIISNTELNDQLQDLAKKTENTMDKAGKKGAKGFFASFKKGFETMKKQWKLAAGSAAALLLGLHMAQDKTTANLEQQIDLADRLATTASQIGAKTEDFSKLYTILRSGDVDSESALTTIKEFSKRLGEFKRSGAQAEVFGGLKNKDDVTKAFLEATAIVNQTQDSARRSALVDQFFGGTGNEQLAEFFTKSVIDLMNKTKGIDFKKYGKSIDELSAQDDIIKNNRIELERDNLVRTAELTKQQGGQLIADRESFNQTQLLQQTNIQAMKSGETLTEGMKVLGNAFVTGTQKLFDFSNSVDSATKSVEKSQSLNTNANSGHISD